MAKFTRRESSDSEYEIGIHDELGRAVTHLYGGVYKRKNPVLGRTRDFSHACVIFHIIVAILKLVFGISYIGDCRANDYIPYYMFIGGILQLLFILTILFRKKKGVWAIQMVIGFTLVIWFIIATINTFFEWEPDYFITGLRYCNKVIYKFSVFICVSECVSIVLLMFLLCIAVSFEIPF